MSTPTDPSRDDELRALRARAYGPDADIHADPAALARLQELEAQRRTATAPVLDEPSPLALFEETGTDAVPVTTRPVDDRAPDELTPAARARAADTSDAPSAPEDDIPSPEPEPAQPEPARPWWRRRRAVWVGSLVIALLLGVGLTLSVQAITSGKVTTLAVDRDGEWPTQMFGERPPGALRFEDFHGLSVFGLGQGFGGGVDQVCISVQSASDGSGSLGAWGCGNVEFPAAASLTVIETAPRELRDAFPVGTSLQFVLDGDQVHVYAKSPGIRASTPASVPGSSAVGG
ncbi:hypothetical protein [Microbacterium sp. NPDC058389]|uniref:hypothetical protein n=1 Tax=Microbacterium sp. NPDC058389 TaxID=3346475 RepID=UPI0036532F8E